MKRLHEQLAASYLQTQLQVQERLSGWAKRAQTEEDGMTTTEYAVGTLAAAAIAGTLLAIAKSGALKPLILGIFKSALDT